MKPTYWRIVDFFFFFGEERGDENVIKLIVMIDEQFCAYAQELNFILKKGELHGIWVISQKSCYQKKV